MKKQHTYTRKDRGVRWLLRLALLLLLLNLTGIYHILPEQSVRGSIQKQGIAPVEVIHREWAGKEPVENWLLMVGENEDALTLTAAEFHPLRGWFGRGTVHEILFEDRESYQRSWIVHDRDDSEKDWVCLFGFVPHGEEPPTFAIGMYDYRAPFGEGEFEDPADYVMYGDYHFAAHDGPSIITPTPTIPVRGGMCYLVHVNLVHKTLDMEQWDSVVLCDVTGQWERCRYWTTTLKG